MLAALKDLDGKAEAHLAGLHIEETGVAQPVGLIGRRPLGFIDGDGQRPVGQWLGLA